VVLTLKEEQRLRMFEKTVLRRMLVPKRDEVMGGGRKLCNKELHDLYYSPSIIGIIMSRKVMWAGHMA
jgi:hypothetical protein